MRPQKGRIESLDALRGFALFGILLVNIQVFSGWGLIGVDAREALPWSTWDKPVREVLNITAHGNFYSLFSLLFGYSFVMLAQKSASAARRTHVHRMSGLFVFGVLHAIFLWPWDILSLYAVTGLVLLLFFGSSARRLLLWAVALLLAIAAARWYSLVHGPLAPWNGVLSSLLGDNTTRFSAGTYLEVIRANMELSVGILADRWEHMRFLRVLAMFLLGAAAARLHLAEPSNESLRVLRVCAYLCVPLAAAAAAGEHLLSHTEPGERLFFALADTAAGPVTAVAYASLLGWWWHYNGRIANAVRDALAPAGRMALTNYLLQSAVCVLVFYGFGLNQFAEHSLLFLVTFATGLFLTQLALSRLWLLRFRQGPTEWLWRWQVQGSRPAFINDRMAERKPG